MHKIIVDLRYGLPDAMGYIAMPLKVTSYIQICIYCIATHQLYTIVISPLDTPTTKLMIAIAASYIATNGAPVNMLNC